MPDDKSKSKPLPLTRDSVREAHSLIAPYIHRTPVLTSNTLSDLASSFNPQASSSSANNTQNGSHTPGETESDLNIKLFFKCENYQKVGAFKYRGATHALSRLSAEELARGVVTHSSGNHAQALALAARTRGVTAHIVMPTISTPSKIAATQGYGANVIFSGSTSQEREAVVEGVMRDTGAVLVPPYDHEHIILGQGTMALEFEEQVEQLCWERPEVDAHRHRTPGMDKAAPANGVNGDHASAAAASGRLDVVIAPLGGGGMLSGVATALAPTSTLVFGAEPSFQGADDGRRSLLTNPPKRIPTVSSLTIADGLRTPLSDLTFGVVSDPNKVAGVYSVSERQIVDAMRLLVERMKVWVEPSAAVGLAVVLYDEGFRQGLREREKTMKEEWERGRTERRARGEHIDESERWTWEGWNIGIVLSGGNTTIDAVTKIFSQFGPEDATDKAGDSIGERRGEREEGVVGMNGERVAENVAG